MATTPQITELRSLINDTSDPYTFPAPELGGYIDAVNGDLRLAASTVWSIKAARLAGLVDVTEGSSSRKLGSLYKQALEMATYYGGDGIPDERQTARAGTRPIVRLV